MHQSLETPLPDRTINSRVIEGLAAAQPLTSKVLWSSGWFNCRSKMVMNICIYLQDLSGAFGRALIIRLSMQFGTYTWSRGYKTFSCSALLRWKIILLINVKMPTIVGILSFISRINYRFWSSKPSISIYLCYFCFMSTLSFMLS